MPKYEVVKDAYIDDTYYTPGAKIEYDGWPGSNLKPLDAAAEKNAARWAELKELRKKDPKAKIPRSPAEDKPEPKKSADK